ncbi:MAG TPA: hypothetical protein VEB64_03330 [Azospirillaceae bacterium]|nr:hypothetical protein [Azospirillaceae bacterium]
MNPRWPSLSGDGPHKHLDEVFARVGKIRSKAIGHAEARFGEALAPHPMDSCAEAMASAKGC